MQTNLNQKRDRIIDIVRSRGPLLPVQITKEIGTDIMFASAFLSELVSSGKIKITSVKLGGSPFYYVSGQEVKLDALTKYLNEKDRNTVQLLRQKRILRDSQCSPLERFSLRQVNDYAVPIKVRLDDNSIEVFWRWHLLDENQAKVLIKDLVEKSMEVKKPKSEVKEVVSEVERVKPVVREREVQVRVEKPKVEAVKETIEKRPLAKEKVTEVRIEKPMVVREEVRKEEKQERLKREIGGFYDSIIEYFKGNNVNILEEKVVRKGKEFNFIVEIRSNIGKVRFFVKCKDKRKISDGDLSLAANEAKGMPLLFLSNGEVSKKLEKQMESSFKGVVFKKIS